MTSDNSRDGIWNRERRDEEGGAYERANPRAERAARRLGTLALARRRILPLTVWRLYEFKLLDVAQPAVHLVRGQTRTRRAEDRRHHLPRGKGGLSEGVYQRGGLSEGELWRRRTVTPTAPDSIAAVALTVAPTPAATPPRPEMPVPTAPRPATTIGAACHHRDTRMRGSSFSGAVKGGQGSAPCDTVAKGCRVWLLVTLRARR